MAGHEGRSKLSPDELRAVASTRESYERIPYHSLPWPGSRPAHLETIAKLWGLQAPAAAGCRVLELGCGDAGNLIPLALAHPDSECLGIDLAKVHIESGRRLAQRLGLRNIRLEATSFNDLGDDLGRFDYVIAHGLMSWVGPGLQQELFATCKRLLAPRGVAFITYNTYPGWYVRAGIREMLLHHTRELDDTRERIQHARALLDFLRRSTLQSEAGYREQIEVVEDIASDPEREFYFAHEYLEDANYPFYFCDFAERAADQGLQYLADADHIDMEIEGITPELQQRVEALSDQRIEALQLLDFARNRKFRQSLLCHEDVALTSQPDFRAVQTMYVAAMLEPSDDSADVGSVSPLEFKNPSGRVLEVDEPLVKAALIRFSEQSIQPIAFDELAAWAYARIGVAPPDDSAKRDADRAMLAEMLGRIFLVDLLELCASPPCWALEVSQRPEASPLVRLDAAEGRHTSSLRHRRLALDNRHVRNVLALLDGSRDRSALLEELGGELPAAELEKILDLGARNAVLIS